MGQIFVESWKSCSKPLLKAKREGRRPPIGQGWRGPAQPQRILGQTGGERGGWRPLLRAGPFFPSPLSPALPPPSPAMVPRTHTLHLAAPLLVLLLVTACCHAQSSSSWDDLLRQQCRGEASQCDVEVPEGVTVHLSEDAEAASVVVKGRLIWPSSHPVVLSAGFIAAERPSGYIEIGTAASPAPDGSGVYIRNNGRSHHALGKRSFGSYGAGSNFHVHGRKLSKTWMLLSRPANTNDRQLTLDDDAAAAGWRVGDRICLAPTASYPRFGADSAANVFTLTGVSGNVVNLNEPVVQARAGFPSKKVQAEVINLSRSVTITGDDFDGQRHGLHVVAHSGGEAQVQYARIERGGQHGVAGKYPLHFHLAGSCPTCRFVGNAIENSAQRGIIIHGSHRTLTSENVIYDVKGSGIYVEDGNGGYQNEKFKAAREATPPARPWIPIPRNPSTHPRAHAHSSDAFLLQRWKM